MLEAGLVHNLYSKVYKLFTMELIEAKGNYVVQCHVATCTFLVFYGYLYMYVVYVRCL